MSIVILPPSYPAYGQALDATAHKLLEIPTPIGQLWNPQAIQADALPFLAWALSVDVWSEDWPIEKKRAVVQAALQDHRLKGTLAGIERYVGYADAELIEAVVPPAKAFLSPSYTQAEREAALIGLPQIRLHRYRANASAIGSYWGDFYGKFFAAGADDAHETPVEFLVDSTAAERLQTQASYWVDGVDTPITSAKSEIINGAEVVYIPGTAPEGIFLGASFFGAGYFKKTNAADRVYTFTLDRTSESERVIHRFPIVPKTATAVNAIPAYVAEHGYAPCSVFSGEPIGQFFVPSSAIDRIYDVVYLNDPTRPLETRNAISFLGDERFGIENFTAELKISVTGKRQAWIFDEFSAGYFYTAPKVALEKMLDAVVSAKSARDKVLVNTKTYRSLTVGTSLFVGAPLILGNYTRS